MKKAIIITGMALAALLTACSDWVNVSPKQGVESVNCLHRKTVIKVL